MVVKGQEWVVAQDCIMQMQAAIAKIEIVCLFMVRLLSSTHYYWINISSTNEEIMIHKPVNPGFLNGL